MKFNLADGIEILQRTPATLRSMLSGLPDQWILPNEGEDTWSAYDIVGHLVYGEKTDWISRTKIILEYGPEKSFTPFDRFAQFKDSAGKSLQQLLDEFETLRTANIETLRSLEIKAADYSRQGRHPNLGDCTLGQLLATWVVHDLGHIRQIARVMAKLYRDEIGPWQAYLPVVNE